MLLSYIGCMKVQQAITAPTVDCVEVVHYDTITISVTTDALPTPVVRDTLHEIRYVQRTITDTIVLDSVIYIVDVDTINVNVPVQVYADTVTVDSVEVMYTSVVAGELLSNDFELRMPRHTRVVVPKHNSISFYNVYGLNLGFSRFQTGIDMVASEWKVGYRFSYDNDAGAAHMLSYGYRFGGF